MIFIATFSVYQYNCININNEKTLLKHLIKTWFYKKGSYL
jgi:hypothetical protein